ncbi:MAG: hypothetical protein NT141_01740 [candidate division WWE3 bacterium]|nr:hypothetical protein [candidate division WWE3 bacterium]
MDLLAIGSLIYLFAGDILPAAPKEVLITPFKDAAGRYVERADLTALCLTAELFDLRRQGLILIEGNGTVTYLKKSGSNQMPSPISDLAIRIIDALKSEAVKLSDFVKKFENTKDTISIIYEDLKRLELVKKVEAKKFLFIKSPDFEFNRQKIEPLENLVPQVQAKIENYKLDPGFNEILAQIKGVI